MNEVIEVMKIVTDPLRNAVLSRLSSTVLSEGEVFTTALMAATGKYANMTTFEQLLAALKKGRTNASGNGKFGNESWLGGKTAKPPSRKWKPGRETAPASIY